MKLKSVKDLYLAKKVILREAQDEVCKNKLTTLINKVLLAEGGSKAVLYPYNSLEETIIQLWGEAMSPRDIATKVGLDEEDGEEIVLCVIEDQSNYEDRELPC